MSLTIAHRRSRPTAAGRYPSRRKGRGIRSERGLVLAWFSLTLLVLLGFAGFGVDTSNGWFVSQRLQRAADAAALAGSVFLPQDLDGARKAALQAAAQNGFADDVSGYTTNAEITVRQEANPYRLRVEIEHSTPTFFAWVFGVDQFNLGRTAVGEYQGPVPMGSPTNNLGNQPVGSGQSRWLTNPTNPDPANTVPQIWANIAGPRTSKDNGDRYATSYCASASPSTHNCSTSGETGNTEYQPSGYYYVVKVRATAADLSKNLRVEAYDPAFVQQGDTCNNFTAGGGSSQESTVRSELIALNVDRYRNPQPTPSGRPFNEAYCTGDHYIRGGVGVPTTTFGMKGWDITPWSSTDNPAIDVDGCRERTFDPIEGQRANNNNGNNGRRLSRLLNPSIFGASDSEAVYAREVYHNWVSLCNTSLSSLGITEAGEYDLLLNVRTSGGAGHNRFSLRAGLSTGSTGAVAGARVSLYANGKLPLYANAQGANSQFFLARVLPGNAGRTLSIQFFDTGDASAKGTITIIPPADAKVNGSPLSQFNSCRFSRLPDGASLSYTANGCILSDVHSGNGYNGRTIIASVPIPSGYSCSEDSNSGCWVKVRFAYGSSVTVNDTTTWSANILGDPVRLVE